MNSDRRMEKRGKASRWRGKMLLVATLLLMVNSAYVAGFADPNIFYIFNSLLHPALGIFAGILFIQFCRSHWQRFDHLGRIGVALLSLAGALGAYLAIVGATRPHQWALLLHILFVLAGLVLVANQLRQMASPSERASAYGQAYRLLVIFLVGSGLLYAGGNWWQRRADDLFYRVRNPMQPPGSAYEEGDGPEGHFFPSSATSTDREWIASEFFTESEACQRCHEDIYDQWFSSAHHFASFNNQWYRKSIEYMQDVNGIKPSLWCGGCHDHAVLFSGMMQKQPVREIIHTKEAQAGLGCMSCHSLVRVNDSMGNAGIVIEYPAMHRYASSKNPIVRKLHDYTVRLNPKPHRRVFLKPFHTQDTAEFCSSCHKVHLDVPVNNYRWIRGFNEYDNWQASGVSGQGARSFYYPERPMKCADCHMPLVASEDMGHRDGKVHSHRFPGANTALPYVNEDAKQLDTTLKFLQDGQVTVDIFGVAEVPGRPARGPSGPGLDGPQIASTFAVGEEGQVTLGGRGVSAAQPVRLQAPLGPVDAQVRRGDAARVEVVVRTRKVGHFFPGGTVDSFDVWLELQAVDETGRILYWSGRVEDNGRGPVEPGAHFYRSLQLDQHANVINKRNAWATRAVVYVNLIPPGAADTVHFRLRVPPDCGDTITLKAKLNYRKFMWWFNQWAFAGVRDPADAEPQVTKHYDDGKWIFSGDTSEVSGKKKHIPNLPIATLAEAEAHLKVLPANEAPPGERLKLAPSVRERWNDYGIGLLRQGDLKGAEAAFLKVTQMEPEYADGWVNVARARLQQGDSGGAKAPLEKALEVDPDLAKTNFFYAMTLKPEGRYDEALAYLRRAAHYYPRDRVVRNQIGRLLFLQRKYAEAIQEFQKVLEVDPEDLQAHYNLMLCYRGLGDDERASEEEKFYLRFKADESSRAITGPYRRAHPEDNNEAQPIHEHVSVPVQSTALTSTGKYSFSAAQGGSR